MQALMPGCKTKEEREWHRILTAVQLWYLQYAHLRNCEMRPRVNIRIPKEFEHLRVPLTPARRPDPFPELDHPKIERDEKGVRVQKTWFPCLVPSGEDLKGAVRMRAWIHSTEEVM